VNCHIRRPLPEPVSTLATNVLPCARLGIVVGPPPARSLRSCSESYFVERRMSPTTLLQPLLSGGSLHHGLPAGLGSGGARVRPAAIHEPSGAHSPPRAPPDRLGSACPAGALLLVRGQHQAGQHVEGSDQYARGRPVRQGPLLRQPDGVEVVKPVLDKAILDDRDPGGRT